MTFSRSLARAALVALVLSPATVLVACGGGDPEPAPQPAPTKPALVPSSAPVPEVVPSTELTPAAPSAEAPVQPATERDAAASALVDRLASVRELAKGLGVELSDEDLAKVAGKIEGAATPENVAAALKAVGIEDPEAAAAALAEKAGVDLGAVPGMGGSEPTKEGAADAVKEAAGGAAETLSVDQLKAERKAAISALELEQEKALAELRAKFAERSSRNPAKAAEHAQKLAEKEAELTAEYAEKIEATRAEYKARLQKAR